MTIELFDPTSELDIRFDRWISKQKNLQAAYIIEIYDTIETSQGLGGFIWDNNLSDLSQFFTRDYWVGNWQAIMGALEYAGTYRAYTQVIKSTLSGEVAVSFSNPANRKLVINVDLAISTEHWLTGEGENVIPDQSNYPSKSMALANPKGELTTNQTIKLIELLTPDYIDVTVSFV